MSRDPRVDSYIAKARPFARPILERVRERVHAIVPEVEEAIKWQHPSYLKGGRILVMTAAFTQHAVVNFWRGQELGFEQNEGGIGERRKLMSIDDLPDDLDMMIARADKLLAKPPPRKRGSPPRPMPDTHPDLLSALKRAPEAQAFFETLAPSHRREYLEWIGQAKQEQTRAKRISTTVEWLSEGKRRNWKYENC